MQWLRDGLKIIATAAESGDLAAASDPSQSVYCVSAFAGLGAPHWSSEARALLCGITRGTTRGEIARAALESVGYQTRDLVEAMRADAATAGTQAIDVIRVDGGMAASDWTMQFLTDILDIPVDRPKDLEFQPRRARPLPPAGRWASTPARVLSREAPPARSPVQAADGRDPARAALPGVAGGRAADVVIA